MQEFLRGRAIGYEFANLIFFSKCHEHYIDRLPKSLNAEPPQNYQATSMAQIVRGDRQVWVYLSQNVSRICLAAVGTRPLDVALEAASNNYDVTFHLLPMPLQPSGAGAPVRTKGAQSNSGNFAKGFNQNRKGKGKSKQNAQGSSTSPRGIKGAVGRDNRGRANGFNYNLLDRPDGPAGGTCKKGRHICFKSNQTALKFISLQLLPRMKCLSRGRRLTDLRLIWLVSPNRTPLSWNFLLGLEE